MSPERDVAYLFTFPQLLGLRMLLDSISYGIQPGDIEGF